MKLIRAIIPLLLTAIIAVPAHAQLKQNDYRKRVGRMEQKRYSTPKKSYPINRQFTGKNYQKNTWTGGQSRLNGQRAPFALTESKDKKRFKTNILEKKTWDRKTAKGLSGKRARFENSDKVRGSEMHPVISSGRVHDYKDLQRHGYFLPKSGEEQFSLQDINRYAFRENRPSEKGLPVQGAGTGPAKAAPAASSGVGDNKTQPGGRARTGAPGMPAIQSGPITTSSRVKE